MSDALYMVAAIVLALLLWLAFRRGKVADQKRHFLVFDQAQEFANNQDAAGYDCFIKYMGTEGRWQVRCYRRKGASQ